MGIHDVVHNTESAECIATPPEEKRANMGTGMMRRKFGDYRAGGF